MKWNQMKQFLLMNHTIVYKKKATIYIYIDILYIYSIEQVFKKKEYLTFILLINNF